MSLANQTCWVVGGVGVIGRGITRALLRSGATVIVNSRSEERLARFSEDLGYPDRLVTIKGSLLPGYAAKTVGKTLNSTPLHHVVAHGAVRYWGESGSANSPRDESHVLLDERARGGGSFLQSTAPEDFAVPSSFLASLHFSAARELVPRIQFSSGPSSYTFVTGDAGGHPEGRRSALGEINTHHVWGLAAALRNEPFERDVNCREVRVRLPVNRPAEEREKEPRERPLSEEIGDLCAGLAAAADAKGDRGALIEVETQESLESLLRRYKADVVADGGDELLDVVANA